MKGGSGAAGAAGRSGTVAASGEAEVAVGMVESVAYDPLRSEEETLAILKSLMVWFKEDYPYYYDGCMECGNAEENVFLGGSPDCLCARPLIYCNFSFHAYH